MAEIEKLTEKDDEDELIPVETPPVIPEPTDDEGDDQPPEEDDGDEEDARLAEDHEGDEEDEAASQSRKRRLKRRDMQKRARENAERELEFLRGETQVMRQRLAALEGHTLTTNEQSLQQQYNQTLQEIQTAETIMAKALEAGNGEDHVLASRIRDQATQRANQIAQAGQQVAQARQQQANPGPDPRVVTHGQEWLQANPWYNPAGNDEDSAIVNAIDISMTRQGFDPTSRAYWEELTNRVAARLGTAEAAPARARRQAPPQGVAREHAPASTRKEIYVTPERKQAMIDAGKWDDPKERTRMLKEYQRYDQAASAR